MWGCGALMFFSLNSNTDYRYHQLIKHKHRSSRTSNIPVFITDVYSVVLCVSYIPATTNWNHNLTVNPARRSAVSAPRSCILDFSICWLLCVCLVHILVTYCLVLHSSFFIQSSPTDRCFLGLPLIVGISAWKILFNGAYIPFLMNY